MQILKDDLHSLLLQIAQEEFYQFGFAKVSMRQIAKKSGMAAGNVYHYFASKDELFEAIVDPVYQQILQLISSQKTHSGENPQELNHELQILAQQLISMTDMNQKSLIILLKGSEGTRFQHVKRELIDYLAEHIKEELVQYYRNRGVEANMALARPLAVSFLEGYFEIICSPHENDTLKKLINEYLQIFKPVFQQMT